jgi:hypothetical protein
MVRWPGGWFGPDPSATARGTTWCAWRLLSANNRELGRSYTTFPSASACAEAVAVLRGHIDHADAAIVAGLRTGLWHWEVSIQNSPVAISPRSFTRQRECEHNLGQFLAGAAVVRENLAIETASVG